MTMTCARSVQAALIDYTVISIARKLHNVSGLAVQGIADCVQRAEAYGAYFSPGTKDDRKCIKNCLPCRIIQIIQKSEGGSSIIVGTVDNKIV